MTIVCDKCGANDYWHESKETQSPAGQATLKCLNCSATKVVARFEYEAHQNRVFQTALVSAVGSISKEGYAVAADARLLGVEKALEQWASLPQKDKSTLWSAMQTGTFTLYAGSMFYLTQCANKSTVPTWDLRNGQSMRTGVDDSGLFGLESAQFVLDASWLNRVQIQRLEAARAKWVELHRADIEIVVNKLAGACTRLDSQSQAELRALLREARQVWKDEQSHLSQGQKSSLQSVIFKGWESIRPRWWEFHLKKRPDEMGLAG